jgi:hypothetical protein
VTDWTSQSSAATIYQKLLKKAKAAQAGETKEATTLVAQAVATEVEAMAVVAAEEETEAVVVDSEAAMVIAMTTVAVVAEAVVVGTRTRVAIPVETAGVAAIRPGELNPALEAMTTLVVHSRRTLQEVVSCQEEATQLHRMIVRALTRLLSRIQARTIHPVMVEWEEVKASEVVEAVAAHSSQARLGKSLLSTL